MKCRVFKKPDGRVAYVWPSQKYQEGHEVDDLQKPIISEVDDLGRPIYEFKEDPESPIVEEVRDFDHPVKVISDEGEESITFPKKKKVIFGFRLKPTLKGYQKKKALVGFEKKKLSFENAKLPPEVEGLPYIDIDEADLPPEEGRDWDSHGPLHFDGELKKENLKFDEKWEHFLMPGHLIKSRQERNLEKELDAILEGQNPNPIEAIKAFRKLQKISKLHHKKDYDKLCEIALEGLDRAEIKKPKIKKLLQEKINEFKSRKK